MRIIAAAAAFATAAGLLVASGGAASASSCPTVDSGTGAVSPPPAPGVDWAGCDLSGADLALANLSGADLSGANLTKADAGAAEFHKANLSGVTFSGASLFQGRLDDANVTSASFAGANLSSALLTGATLTRARLAGATLDEVLTGQLSGTPASLPPHWVARRGYLLGPLADLSDADLKGAALSGLDLAGASFINSNLDGADLAQADLRGADLRGASVFGADVGGTDLARALLAGLNSGHVTGIPAGVPSPWVVRDGYFFGPFASLRVKDLAGLDLTGTDLTGAQMFSDELFGADLAGVNLAGADLTFSDLRGADLFGANVRNVKWADAACPGGNHPIRDKCVLAFRLGAFTTPKPGTSVRVPRRLRVEFRLLATALGTPIASRFAAAIARARRVRVVLTGKGIKAAASNCDWNSRHRLFQCDVTVPRPIATGKSHRYLLTVQEKPQDRFVPAGSIFRDAPNPETIFFTAAAAR